MIINNIFYIFIGMNRKKETLKSENLKPAKDLIGLPGNVTEDDIGLGRS